MVGRCSTAAQAEVELFEGLFVWLPTFDSDVSLNERPEDGMAFQRGRQFDNALTVHFQFQAGTDDPPFLKVGRG
jgi:hypothetical protein